MGYKKMKKNLGFADFALANSLKHNRSLKLMDKLNSSLNWDRIESILMSHYSVGTSTEGADAYPPLLLFKCETFAQPPKKSVFRSRFSEVALIS